MFQSSSAGIRNVVFGANVKVIEPCNLYECAVGDDSFVGLGAVVIRDVETCSVVVGNPAKPYVKENIPIAIESTGNSI